MSRARRACPVCGGAARTPLFSQAFAIVEGVSLVDGYTVVVCDDCGAAFADGVPSQAAFDRHYREQSKYTYTQRGGLESPADAVRLAATADRISTWLPDRQVAVADVGCASGRLLAELGRRGYQRARGVDPSPECAAAARALHGVRAEAMTLAQLATAGEAFDLVTLVGVLEHLVELAPALEAVARLTRPGGHVYLEVPDAARFADFPNAPFQEFSVEHVNFFSSESLAAALGRAGFQVVAVDPHAPVQAGTTRVANLAVLARRSGTTPTMSPDRISRPALERYVDRSRAAEVAIHDRISALARSREPLVVWGAGTLALRLFATSVLAEANVVAVTDSDARYHGRTVRALPIVPPEATAGLARTYVVASWGYLNEIADQIRDISGPGSRVIPLGNAEGNDDRPET